MFRCTVHFVHSLRSNRLASCAVQAVTFKYKYTAFTRICNLNHTYMVGTYIKNNIFSFFEYVHFL